MQTSIKPNTDFSVWKRRFREDCYQHDRQTAFDDIGDMVLRLLWESGLEPTVKAVVAGVKEDRTSEPD